jgi:hypothetical protein
MDHANLSRSAAERSNSHTRFVRMIHFMSCEMQSVQTTSQVLKKLSVAVTFHCIWMNGFKVFVRNFVNKSGATSLNRRPSCLYSCVRCDLESSTNLSSLYCVHTRYYVGGTSTSYRLFWHELDTTLDLTGRAGARSTHFRLRELTMTTLPCPFS